MSALPFILLFYFKIIRGAFRYHPGNGVAIISTDGGATCKFYRQHRYLAQVHRATIFFSFLMVIFKVISNSNPLKGLIMEKLEKYLYISPSRRPMGCKIWKIKFATIFQNARGRLVANAE